MNRRDFVLSSAGLSFACIAWGQQAEKLRRIGMLVTGSLASHSAYLEAFRDGLREFGWLEGRNIALDLRFAEGNLGRLPSLAAELVARRPELIVSASNVGHLAARKATATIPIVMATGGDPVAAGLAESFARPGGNVTGLSGFYDELPAKLLELSGALLPRGARVIVLLDRSVPFHHGAGRATMESAAKAAGLRVEFVELAEPNDIARALAASGKPLPSAFVVMSSPMFFALRDSMVARAGALKVPMTSPFEEMTEAGGLMSYSVNIRASYRRAAWYVNQILRGAQPGDLPIEQPTQISLAVNLKVARALGLAIPPSLRVRADRVIE